MQRTQGKVNSRAVVRILLAGLVMLLVPAAWGAGGGSGVISGVVRDAQGVAQMGALVQVLVGDSVTVATAFTDGRGRYVVANLLPGKYLVRASATLFVPATRANLQLRTGASAVVNLTLAALFDTASWLPAQRRRADEAEDDWKWTLRSTANRPILRIVEDGAVIEVSSSAAGRAGEKSAGPQTKARVGVGSGDGGFGSGGVHQVLAMHRVMEDGGDAMLRADVGSKKEGAAYAPAYFAPSIDLDTGLERRVGSGGGSRVVVSYKSHPELVSAGGAGVQVMEITSGQRMSLGDRLEVEAGGRMESVHAVQFALAARPFFRVTGHVGGGWTIQYRMATEREVQGFDDVTSGPEEVPVAVVKDGRLALERGRHQEVAAARKGARGSVEAAYYHDAIAATSLSGGFSGSGLPAAAGMLVDPTTGTLRALGGGYTTNGVRVTASTPITSALWVAAEYSSGDAMGSATGGDASYAEALAGVKAQGSQTATVALKGRVVGTGTRVRASYRWQPASMVTAVDPYSAFGDQAFFSCLVRQPIRVGKMLPQGLNATIDVTNLLAEGYRPFLSADGQTLYFAQTPRTIQAGLSFSF